jgi:hypothetical protein
MIVFRTRDRRKGSIGTSVNASAKTGTRDYSVNTQFRELVRRKLSLPMKLFQL